MTKINKILLIICGLILLNNCQGPKQVKHYPNSIPPFLQEEIEIENVFQAPKVPKN